MKERKRAPVIKLLIIVILIAAILAVYLLYGRDKPVTTTLNTTGSAGKRGSRAGEQVDDSDRLDITRGEFTFEGERYRYNDHLSNYLFLGIDKRDLVDTKKGNADAGQSDAIYLISNDRATGKATLISIPRDTMTYITIYTKDIGNEYTWFDHLSTQYGYGDGKHESCKLSAKSVSYLFHGMPVEGYCAIALSALSVMAADIPEITVTVPDNSLEFRNDEFASGSRVVLDENNIEEFLRIRDIDTDNSAIPRMERQKVFLKSFFQRAWECYSDNPHMITKLFEDLQPCMVTNMGTDKFSKLMYAACMEGGMPEWTVPGEGVQTETYDEFHYDEEGLMRLIVDTLCVKVE